MGSLPPVEGSVAPAAPASPAAPAPEALVLWVYVDDAQRHEIQAGMRKGEPLEFFVKETERGNADPAEAFEWSFPIQGTWESRLHHLALEERLTLLGRYQRHSVGAQGWRRVTQNVGAKRLDLDPVDSGGEFGATRVHYYGSRQGTRSVLLLETPTHGALGERVRLARLDFEFPRADVGTLRIVHGALPPLLARSVLAGIHLDLVGAKLEKVLAVDRHARANAAWWNELSACVRAALDRLRANALGKGRPSPAPEAALARPPREGAPYSIEDAFPAPASRAPEKPVAKIEDSLLDLKAALQHPRLLALHRRYLTPEEERMALAEGEIGITSLLKRKRAESGPDQQHLLSVLEASLHARHRLARPGDVRLDPQMAELLKRALVYL